MRMIHHASDRGFHFPSLLSPSPSPPRHSAAVTDTQQRRLPKLKSRKAREPWPVRHDERHVHVHRRRALAHSLTPNESAAAAMVDQPDSVQTSGSEIQFWSESRARAQTRKRPRTRTASVKARAETKPQTSTKCNIVHEQRTTRTAAVPLL